MFQNLASFVRIQISSISCIVCILQVHGAENKSFHDISLVSLHASKMTKSALAKTYVAYVLTCGWLWWRAALCLLLSCQLQFPRDTFLFCIISILYGSSRPNTYLAWLGRIWRGNTAVKHQTV